jgi:hypothetical protein
MLKENKIKFTSHSLRSTFKVSVYLMQSEILFWSIFCQQVVLMSRRTDHHV